MPRLAHRLSVLESSMHRAKHDAYGTPISPLTSTPETREHPRNVSQRKRIMQALLTTLEDTYTGLLRQDVTARVTLSFLIDRGILGDDIEISVSRRHRSPREELG